MSMDTPSSDQSLEAPDLIPARMLNEFTYCPRLCYLEWVQGEFEDNEFTVGGSVVHKRVDDSRGDLPAAESDKQPASDSEEPPFVATSIMLSAPQAGVIARIDLVEGEGQDVSPVDYKRGSVPNRPGNAWEPDRIQICAQALTLRENGYTCNQGVVYYAASRRRVVIPVDEELINDTMATIRDVRETMSRGIIPDPLDDSPKCNGCSLVGICLPDELNQLAQRSLGEVRRLYPARDDAMPVYVHEQGTTIRKQGDVIVFQYRSGDVADKVRLMDISQLCLFGNISITSPALRSLCERQIPICHYSYGGWFNAVTMGLPGRNIEVRISQYAAAADKSRSLALARQFVSAKIKNSRTLLRRNHVDLPKAVFDELRRLASKAQRVASIESLFGIEGAAARVYFAHFGGMLKPPASNHPLAFDFNGRNRRPPKDPVNALLSFVYAMLVKEFTIATFACHLDPFLAFFHQPRYGRPALALDLMEEFRSVLADSTVISLINNGEIKPQDFIHRGGSYAMSKEGRQKVIAGFERRLDTLVTHPVFDYTISYRRVLHVQARLLARHLTGELNHYPAFRIR